MFDLQLEKFQDFKDYIDGYLNEEYPKEEILLNLRELGDLYERQHSAVLTELEKDKELVKEHKAWIAKLRTAFSCFEDARDDVEEAIEDDNMDLLEEAFMTFKDGNKLLLEVHYELEELIERRSFGGHM